MPLGEDESLLGTNQDGSRNQDYCTYCYQKGAFSSDETMEEMLESCIPHMVSEDGMNETQARALLAETLPNLKRWKIQKS